MEAGEHAGEKERSGKLRWVFEHIILPSLTALLAYYLLHSRLEEFAERLPDPYSDIIAHPIAENLLSIFFSALYFIFGFFKRKPARLAFVYVIAVMAADFFLANRLGPALLGLFDATMLLFGLSALILLLWYLAAKPDSDDDDREYITPYGGPIAFDLGVFSIFAFLGYAALAAVSGAFSGISLWKIAKLPGLVSCLGAALMFVLLAGGYIFVWNSKLKQKAATKK